MEQLREIPRLQGRSLAESLAELACHYPDWRESMARTFQSGVYTMQEIADFFGVHYSTVSRVVRRFQDEAYSIVSAAGKKTNA